MDEFAEDKEREERISNEIVVDSYDSEEQAMGWQAYLDSTLQFPFSAKCIARREISPLEIGEKVKVLRMAPDEDCMYGMLVIVQWKSYQLGVPLIQLEGIQVDKKTQQAIEDWRYWVERGYSF
jgi:hypothetical protein